MVSWLIPSFLVISLYLGPGLPMELPPNFYTSLVFWAWTHFWLLALILRCCLSNVWAPSPLWVTLSPRIPTSPQAQTGLPEQTSALLHLGLHMAQAQNGDQKFIRLCPEEWRWQHSKSASCLNTLESICLFWNHCVEHDSKHESIVVGVTH